MSRRALGNMVGLMILSALTDARSSIYNYTSGFSWNDKSYDMKSINKAKKKNRKKKRGK